MTHPHAHILQAIIDGKNSFQVRIHLSYQWSDIDAACALRHLSNIIESDFEEKTELRIKPTTVTINGVELEDDRIKYGDAASPNGYFAEQPYLQGFYSHHPYPSNINETQVERGLLHRTKEGAIAFCKARLGIKD